MYLETHLKVLNIFVPVLFPFFRAQGFTCVAEAVGADHRATKKAATKPQT